MDEAPRFYNVDKSDREPLVRFMVDALVGAGCRILHQSPPNRAPFRITFEAPNSERMAIMAYAFLANNKLTKNRPPDEHRFQIKYGSKEAAPQTIWQDPFGLYVTLFLGINPELGIFVGADPTLHNPTKFFISLEFKQAHVDEILRTGWHAWERERKSRDDEGPVEVLVGGTAASFLHYIRFERQALGLDQGPRQLLAERSAALPLVTATPAAVEQLPEAEQVHALSQELALSETEVLDLIGSARRLKMAVRGWAAEEHLVRVLRQVPGVSECMRSDEEGGPDVLLRFHGSRPIRIECKNVLRQRTAEGTVRLDFQRTRASSDPCSRYYSPQDFDIVAACLHAVSERWEFQFARTTWLDPHPKCPGKLLHRVRLDDRWSQPIEAVLADAVRA
ncbi:hypothetical protein [Polyangium aurulentum]|uniref:hypothetical protein n=1 Tax=Polyangium aurulentum TaxID=2567896 RepID=UPI0010ADBE5D|nr:hypothetical protein [Polyangium aurulentum]UQA58816.1 hypothetical protein E8A73_047605 [Polyangium aurulentum]